MMVCGEVPAEYMQSKKDGALASSWTFLERAKIVHELGLRISVKSTFLEVSSQMGTSEPIFGSRRRARSEAAGEKEQPSCTHETVLPLLPLAQILALNVQDPAGTSSDADSVAAVPIGDQDRQPSPLQLARQLLNGLPRPSLPLQDTPAFSSQQASTEMSAPASQEGRTTLMLKNLPSCYVREKLMQLIDSEGFAGEYDFVYVPLDSFSGAGLGYAFLNMSCEAAAERVMQQLHGFRNWNVKSQKVLTTYWGTQQGLEQLIERYRNSRMMHNSVPDIYKPLLLIDGEPTTFPPPTKRVTKPRCFKKALAGRDRRPYQCNDSLLLKRMS